jgi:pentapeptide repeat protein
MTVRDWLPIVGALLIPVVIALGTWWITWQQGKIEDRRAKAEREIAEQRAQDEALQAYLDQMSQLMLDRKLLEAEPGNPVHTLAQARTSTAILRLDAEHNESLTRFLSDSGLAGSDESTDGLLRGIALSRATLSGAFLPNADLSGANLSGANLRGAESITNEELEQQAASLEGTTMPNGQKYEDWLKSKGRGEDG